MVYIWHIYAPTLPIYALKGMPYMCNVVGIFVFGTYMYMAVTCEVNFAVGCVVADISISVTMWQL